MGVSVFDMQAMQHNWSTEETRAIFDERARLQKWLDIEAALAAAQAELNLIPAEAAREIAAQARIDRIDIDQFGADIRRVKHALVPLLRQVQANCAGDHGQWVHLGATTQDIIDTGVILQVRDAHALYMRDIALVGQELARLADAHRDTIMAGRTHGVMALPITFGHKCAIWLDEMIRHHERMVQLEPRLFVGELVGAVGSQASFGPRAREVEVLTLRKLGLGVPDISWAPARDRLVEYTSLLALIGGTLGKIGNELFNMQRNEFAEVEETFTKGKLGSSTMPHKRNPVMAENIACISRGIRYAAGMMLEAMVAEGERDGIAWKTEWKALPECCLITGSGPVPSGGPAARPARRRGADGAQPRADARLPAVRARDARTGCQGRQAERARVDLRGVDGGDREQARLRRGDAASSRDREGGHRRGDRGDDRSGRLPRRDGRQHRSRARPRGEFGLDQATGVGGVTRYSTLIQPEELAKLLRDAPDAVVTCDCSFDLVDHDAGRRAFAAGHVAGAVHLPLEDVLSGAKTGRNGRHPLPDREGLAAHLAGLGVSTTTQVVAYDGTGGIYAARLWFLLRWLGHDAVAVLDGGLAGWRAAGEAVEAAPPIARPRGDLVARPSLVPTMDYEAVKAASEAGDRLIIDARAPDRFRGENETLDPVGGHIPGARNRFFRDNLTKEGRFKAPDVLRAEFTAVLNGRSASDTVAQCGSGVTACHNLLAMEVAGLRGAALYPGSWSDWSARPGAPIAQGAG